MPNQRQIIIFTHFGNSSYLEYTLACARKTNPEARLIFLGDYFNLHTAKQHGGEHHFFGGPPGPDRARFNRVFRHVRGPNHPSFQYGADWLRYVFERWFYVQEFIASQGITRFWHFDSDTMILQNLTPHAQRLADVDFTVQCGGACLNGLVSRVVVDEFCRYVCDLFEDQDLLTQQQMRYDTIHPAYALTEMFAFRRFKEQTQRPWKHLMHYQEDVAFDDCVGMPDGFDELRMGPNRAMKQLYNHNGKIYGSRNGQLVEFVSVNLSWQQDGMFKWVLDCIK